MLSLESQRVFQICFCFVLLYNKSLNDWSLGDDLFPSNLNVFRDERFSGNKIHCSPRDQSLSVNCYIAGVFPATVRLFIG